MCSRPSPCRSPSDCSAASCRRGAPPASIPSRRCGRNSARGDALLARVVEDDPQAVACPGQQAADAVAHDGAVVTAGAPHGALARGEDDDLPLLQSDRLSARLLARALLDQEELSAGVIGTAAAQDARELQREGHVAVEILVQAIEAAGFVAQEERCRL